MERVALSIANQSQKKNSKKNLQFHSRQQGKWVVLFFYPLDFTFVCPTEIIAFSDAASRFKEIGAEIVGVSVDSQFSHLAWVETPRARGGLGGCSYPLVADITKSISSDYGVLIDSGDNAGVALRGLFLISPTGVLRQITVNDLPVGRSVEETLRLVKAFQFTDEHGEVCPAGWEPGSKTIKPDVEGSKEYFEGVAAAAGGAEDGSKKRKA